MSRSPGLGTAGAAKAFARRTQPPNDSVESVPRGGGFVRALASVPGAGLQLIEVPIDERLADKPDNPRRKLVDLDDLAESIKARGLLEPLLVVRAEAFAAAQPDAPLGRGVEWVLLAGHRRRAAAVKAGLDRLPAIVRDDQAGPVDSAISTLVENVHRADLAPLEEARALSMLRDLGLPQREIAKQTGISQGQVSKRLQLLQMPAEVQEAVDVGEVEVTTALMMAHELPDRSEQLKALEVARAEQRPLDSVVRSLRRQPGTPPAQGAGFWQGPAQPAAKEPASMGEPASMMGEQRAPATVRPTDTATAGTAPDDALEEHAAAAGARWDACRAATHTTLKATEITQLLIDATLTPAPTQPSHALVTAADWADVELAPGDPGSAVEQALTGGGKAAQRLAVAVALARRELDLARSMHAQKPWAAANRRHVQRLVEWGVHTPSRYEQMKLTEPLD